MFDNACRNQVIQMAMLDHFEIIFEDYHFENRVQSLNKYDRAIECFKAVYTNSGVIKKIYYRPPEEKRERLTWIELTGILKKYLAYFVISKHHYQKENEMNLFTNRVGNSKKGDEDSSIFVTIGKMNNY